MQSGWCIPGTLVHGTRADRLHCTQGNPSLLPSQGNGRLLLNSLGPFQSTRSNSGVVGLQGERGIWRGKGCGALHKFAKPEADALC